MGERRNVAKNSRSFETERLQENTTTKMEVLRKTQRQTAGDEKEGNDQEQGIVVVGESRNSNGK